ncbi:MAG: efflux RND transporter permease subunit, partial [Polyangiaceae bacterium]|nr:efflux RND transporter permease subunit [Polyangiaceae bacterium]
MSALARVMDQQRLVLGLAALLSVSGLAAALTMPREEDPQFPKRFGQLVVQLPGADALTMERLVVEPLERHFAEVLEIRHVDADVRSGVAAFQIALEDTIYDTEAAWDAVQDAVDDARTELP